MIGQEFEFAVKNKDSDDFWKKGQKMTFERKDKNKDSDDFWKKSQK